MYITTDCLANIFPFYIENITDRNGIIFGKNEQKRLCIIDIFKNTYENSNICIFGCSGSGKSFFTKLLILRNYFQGKRQIILDIEREYECLADSLSGEKVFLDSYINILEITNKDIKNAQQNNINFLELKIDRLSSYLENYLNTSKYKITDYLYEVYKSKGITKDINTIFKVENKNNIYVTPQIIPSQSFPTLIDLLNIVKEKEIKEKLEKSIENELKYFSKFTTINLENPVLVLNMKEIIYYPSIVVDILKNIMNYIGDEQTIIYIDEIWKYSQNEDLLSEVFNMYKTIRKRNASIVTITQDISDYFEYKNGKYAKSILNNSCFKIFFKTELIDIKNIVSNIELNTNTSFLPKGEAILFIRNNNLKISINANDFERRLIDANNSSR